MEKVNRIIDDLICIAAVIIFPNFLLKLLGYTDLVEKWGGL